MDNNVKKDNKGFKIIILFLVALIVVGGVYLLINKDAILKKHEFEIAESEKMFEIGSLEELNNNDNYIYKVELTMNNNTVYDIDNNQYLFEIVDELKMKIGTCFGKSLADDKRDDMFPEIVKANSKTTGYLYCISAIVDEKQLKVTYVTNARIGEDGTLAVDKNEYYFDFK